MDPSRADRAARHRPPHGRTSPDAQGASLDDRKRAGATPRASAARAIEVFESREAAKQWLQEASTALGERKPIDLLATDIGTEVVLNELGKIDHGFFA